MEASNQIPWKSVEDRVGDGRTVRVQLVGSRAYVELSTVASKAESLLLGRPVRAELSSRERGRWGLFCCFDMIEYAAMTFIYQREEEFTCREVMYRELQE